MCFVLYAGAQTPLPESEWDESNRQVFVKQLDEDEKPVRQAFTTESVQYIGSSQHCGCGFRSKMQLEAPYFPDEDDADGDRQLNHRQLVDAIRSTVEIDREFVLFGCWWGDWEPKDAQPVKVVLADLAKDDFAFVEGYRYAILP